MLRVVSIFTRLATVCGILAILLVASAPSLYAETNTPSDTPTPVVTDSVEEWSVGNGLIYWAYNCYADEFVSTAALKRKPVNGSIQRVLESIDDATKCVTYRNQLSASDGLYYLDDSEGRIARMPLGEPYTPTEVKAVSGNQSLGFNSPPAEANGYLYWIGFKQILRTLKDGSGAIETVATSDSLIADIMVIGSTVYWVDDSGIKSTSVNCDTLPCIDTAGTIHTFSSTTRGAGLFHRVINSGPIALRGTVIYWVEHNTSAPYTYKIRNCAVGPFVLACEDPVVSPGAATAAAAPDAVGTFYTATTNWYIGKPILVNGNIYWTERDISSVNNNTGDVKRKAATAAEADPADTIATNQTNIDGRLYAANDLLFFARRSTGIYSLSLTATAITRDFEASGLEVTQAIQNLANSAPLVANKTTYVRAYGKQLAGPSAPNVEARLVGTKNGNPLPGSPLQPLNGARALTTGGSFDRARLNDGWYFQLPGSWIGAGQITLKLEIDGRQIHNDPNRANNDLSQAVTFQNQPPVCVWTVPVRTHTPLPSTTDPNFWGMVSHFNRRWPVPDTWIFRDTDPVEELQVCWAGPFPYPCYGPYELQDGWSITNGPPDRDKVIISLWARALLSFNPDACDDVSAPVHFMGMVHPNANNGGASGYASLISKQSWVQLPPHTPNPIPAGWDMLRAGKVMAQELAHNFGRKHVNCGGPDNIDTGYPYPPCQIANVGADSYYGFDVTTQQPIRPNGAADFMSYRDPSWVSDYTWRALMNSFALANVTGASAAPGAGNSVFVSGLVDTENNRGQLSTVLVLPTSSVPLATVRSLAMQTSAAAHDTITHAIFKLRLLDAAGTVLVERTLTLTEMDNHAPGSASALFSDLFDEPTGQVAKVQLLADNTVIDEIAPGAAAPTVSIAQPASGSTVSDSMTIAWSADDADANDQLLFTVQYSHDNGAKWHTIVVNFPSTPDKNYTLTLDDLGGLPGSAPNQALIRVLASDGYHTTIATSQPFTVNNRQPEPVILVPVENQTFAAGLAIPLSGRATDPEDGGLSGSSLIWDVDNNAAGAGTDTSVAGLAPGAHIAKLTATDSVSNSATASVNFAIAPLSVPISTTMPTLDGGCDDGAYASGQLISLKPYADGSQATVRILRSTDYLWACFSGMQKGAENPGAFAGLRVDADNSRNPNAQSDDYGYFVGEDGDVFSLAGNGIGGFSDPGPSGLVGQINSGANSWNAELRIDKANFNGWDHLVGLSMGHYWLNSQGDDYVWPYASVYNHPDSWARSALGSQPLITALDPFTATINSTAFTLTVEGSDFISGTTVLWNATELPTTFVDGEHLVAQVGAVDLGVAGVAQIKTRAPGDFESNTLPFDVEALPPTITNLTPSGIVAGSPTTTLTINGSNFAPDAQVLWNGEPLATQFVNATQVTVQLSAALLADGQTAGVAVRNQSPEERISDAAVFEVTPQETEPAAKQTYLPIVKK
ncbi:MAG: IPT/TIG domain-containing protein [Caldilineaceae bacterium]|nr:IPT/TIG domain-containing protein [Caldilineaceae bacterium]